MKDSLVQPIPHAMSNNAVTSTFTTAPVLFIYLFIKHQKVMSAAAVVFLSAFLEHWNFNDIADQESEWQGPVAEAA